MSLFPVFPQKSIADQGVLYSRLSVPFTDNPSLDGDDFAKKAVSFVYPLV
ncbi:MAG: hypothetical protein F6K50_33560 [Moorea sp. SIO3I7]|nr:MULTISPECIES: hypothetical protein [unclassified Moorena]NEO00209.1 hypothetical protein [Moorena sp. SIO3I7]NEO13200.1 hypothetical protein [Moorena sp. SIO3E8]NEO24392.1 hypothetical protein [Moorena sp. SIO4A5]NEQ01081.1 hypothetical protein [Moorena sp. SIO3F7]